LIEYEYGYGKKPDFVDKMRVELSKWVKIRRSTRSNMGLDRVRLKLFYKF